MKKTVLRKLGKMSRLTIATLFIVCLFSNMMYASEPVEAQSLADVQVKLDVDKANLAELFNLVEEQTGFWFVYPASLAEEINTTFSYSNQSVSVAALLTDISSQTGLWFRQLSRTIAVNTENVWPQASLSELIMPDEQQAETITGRIVDSQTGEALPGVNILILGTNTGTSTSSDGTFQLNVPSLSDTLLVSYIGYQRKEVPINGRTELDIQLQQQQVMGDALVVVAYGMQEKATVTASIASVEGGRIETVPTANISTSIAGRLSGVLSMQDSGEPGEDQTTLRVRGVGTTGNASPLVVVDGIPRSFNSLSPNEIESITVLKDPAAIAPYGMAGANGVILVTTRRGQEGQLSMSYNGWVGYQRPTRYPNYLDAYDYANLLNTANENVGNPSPFSADDLQRFRDGTSPDTHHNHDWFRDVLNFSAPMTNHTLTLSGGSERIRFYSSLGYMYQEGVVDVINYSRYNLMANVDIDVTENTSVFLNVRGRLEQKNDPGGVSGEGIFTSITRWPPTHPLAFSDGRPGMELLPSIYDSGYFTQDDNTLQTSLRIEQMVPFIPGLALTGLFSYDKIYSYDKRWRTGFEYFQFNEDQSTLVPVPSGLSAPDLRERFEQRGSITMQAHLNYRNNFRNHYINAVGVAEQRSWIENNISATRRNYGLNFDELSLGSSDPSDWENDGSSSESIQVGLVSRISYHYDYRYLLEFSGRYDGHYYFAPGSRFAFFPAISAGWGISEERFFRDRFPWVNYLKIRASVGESGNLAGGPFQYLGSYDITNAYIFDGVQTIGAQERNEPNINITWETSRKANIGLEGDLWEGKLGFEVDLFWERRTNMLLQPTASVPAEYGIGISQENAGIMQNRGIEFSLNTIQRFHEVQFDAGFNFTFARNKLIEVFETDATRNNPNRSRTGRPLGTQFGYLAVGLFQSEQEIAEHATQFGNLQPGDIKYADLNGDGVINEEDMIAIGNPRFPEIIFGFTSGVSWRGFDMEMHWQGATNVDVEIRDEIASPFFNNGKAMKRHLDYWTPDNPNASNPRLTPSPTTNNGQISSFWMRDGSYLRLKSLDVGYTFSGAFVQVLGLRAARIYVSGQNLITISHMNYLDPEMSNPRARFYFQHKTYSMGLKVDF